MKIIPYLSYSGSCAEAFQFYASATSGKIAMMMTYGQAPPGEPVPPNMTDKVMHATFTIGDSVIMGSDYPSQYASTPAGFYVSINVDTPDEANRLYTALSADGSIQMPITETFWAQRFAMFTDKFNIPWMINCEKPMD
jgi:PhnB protein